MLQYYPKVCPCCIGVCVGEEKTRLGYCNDCISYTFMGICLVIGFPIYLIYLLFLLITCGCCCSPYICEGGDDNFCGFIDCYFGCCMGYVKRCFCCFFSLNDYKLKEEDFV